MSFRPAHPKSRCHRSVAIAVPCVASWGLAFLATTDAGAQEAYRASVAGQAAAEARQRAMQDPNYNLKLGPVTLRFSSQMSMEANDNVNLEKDNPKGDFILSPQMSMSGVWRITKKNALTFSTGVGYRYYVDGTEQGGIYVTPGTAIGFDVYVKDFVINLHDSFSYTPNVTGDPQVSGVGTLDTMENTSGIGVTWDLNQAVLSLGYDHVIHKTFNSDYSNDSRTLDLLNLSGGVRVRPTSLAGVQISGGFTDNQASSDPDSSHVAAGLFYRTQMSEYFSLSVSGGYVTYFFDSSAGNANGAHSTVSAFYGDLSIEQRVNAFYSHSFSAGRSLQAGTSNDTTDLIHVTYSAVWKLFRKTSFHYSLSFEHYEDTQVYTDSGERYGFGLGFSRPITRKMGGSLDYHFYDKDAKDPSQDYTQNQLVLTLGYSF
jgi:hypothetical protein